MKFCLLYDKIPSFLLFYLVTVLLNGVSTILSISCGNINLFLLSKTILEEVCSNLREQCIGKNVLILLLPLLNFLFKLAKTGLKLISRSACDNLSVAEG